MFDIESDIKKRVDFIKKLLKKSRANGVVFGNSGGKDCALVGILCKMATENVISVMMPCGSKINYGSDIKDAKEVADAFNIKNLTVDLTPARNCLLQECKKESDITHLASTNINPRLRMTTLYLIAQSNNMLVAGTGNKSEIHLGYFTKFGDGAYDFNPIADLTATQVFSYLKHLNAPQSVITKSPSANLFDGQTDESDLGMTYLEIDEYLTSGKASVEVKEKIDLMHKKTAHKRKMPLTFKTKLK